MYLVKTTVITVGIIVIVTIFQVILSVRRLMGTITVDKARRYWNMVIIVAAILLALLYSASTVIYILLDSLRSTVLALSYFFIAVYLLLILTYSVSIAFLQETLKSID